MCKSTPNAEARRTQRTLRKTKRGLSAMTWVAVISGVQEISLSSPLRLCVGCGTTIGTFSPTASEMIDDTSDGFGQNGDIKVDQQPKLFV